MTKLRDEFDAERKRLLTRVDELTIGGEIDLDYDSDFADRGQVTGEQGENYTWAESLQHQIVALEAAIGRIDAGTYGVCEICSGEISEARLEAIPETVRCIEHAEAG